MVVVVLVVVGPEIMPDRFVSISYEDPYHASGFPQQTPALNRY